MQQDDIWRSQVGLVTSMHHLTDSMKKANINRTKKTEFNFWVLRATVIFLIFKRISKYHFTCKDVT